VLFLCRGAAERAQEEGQVPDLAALMKFEGIVWYFNFNGCRQCRKKREFLRYWKAEFSIIRIG
jgi:uncharacterized ParB-like nuclease family protein